MKTHRLASFWAIFLFYTILLHSQAHPFTLLQKGRALYFKDEAYQIKKGDTFTDLAVTFKVGYAALVLANPGVDPWVPEAGTRIVIPKRLLLPQEFLLNLPTYILINLPEMRLYYFEKGAFKVFPVGIGDEGKLTPTGNYQIMRKKERPYWYPTENIRREEPDLPKVVPPGPENPMGEYALYLDKGLFAIHGTNKPYSIGRRTTHGCFRLYPEEIEWLFKRVPQKTQVFVVYEPYKLALEGGKIYLQAYPDIEKRISNPLPYLLSRLDKMVPQGLTYQIDLLKLDQILANPDGLVHQIGKIKSP